MTTSTTTPATLFEDSDTFSGRAFAADHAAVARWVDDWASWVVFGGDRWERDGNGILTERLAKQTADRLAREAAARVKTAADALTAGDDETAKDKAARLRDAARRALSFAKKLHDVRGLRNMLAAARSEPAVLVRRGDEVFDTHPHLLNVPNGTIDLRTGSLRPHDPADFLTRMCPTRFDPAATCPRFGRFMTELFPADPALVAYMSRMLGYCLTGATSDQSYLLFDGGGSNGKTALLTAVQEVIGPEYTYTVPAEVLMDGSGGRHPTERAGFRGCRLAYVEETEEESALNESRIKQLTGGGRMSARYCHGNFFEFEPSHKLILSTNYRPTVRGTDDGTWRRPRVIPFRAWFYKPADKAADAKRAALPTSRPADPHLKAALAAEATGILSLLVREAAGFYAGPGRIDPPASVTAAVSEYRREQDAIGEFFDRRCRPDLYGHTSGADFYKSYKAFAEAEGYTRPAGPRRFGERAKARYEWSRPSGMVYKVEIFSTDLPSLGYSSNGGTEGSEGVPVNRYAGDSDFLGVYGPPSEPSVPPSAERQPLWPDQRYPD